MFHSMAFTSVVWHEAWLNFPSTVVYRYLGPIDNRLESFGLVHFSSGSASTGPENCLVLDRVVFNGNPQDEWGSKLVAIHNSCISESMDRLRTPHFFLHSIHFGLKLGLFISCLSYASGGTTEEILFKGKKKNKPPNPSTCVQPIWVSYTAASHP